MFIGKQLVCDKMFILNNMICKEFYKSCCVNLTAGSFFNE